HVVKPKLVDIVDGRAQPDGCGDVGRSRLELVGNDVVNRLLEGDRADHVAASLVRRHGFKQPGFAVEHADAGGAKNLVTGHGVKVAIELPDVDLEVRCRLSAVDEHRNVHAVRRLDDLAHRIDGAEHVGDMSDRNQSGPRVQQLLELLENHLAAVVD